MIYSAVGSRIGPPHYSARALGVCVGQNDTPIDQRRLVEKLQYPDQMVTVRPTVEVPS